MRRNGHQHRLRHRFRRRSRAARAEADGLTATCRVDRRTKNLIPRLERGDIAVVDHADIDRVAADALVAAGVVAVVNARLTMTGAYPALGGLTLTHAQVPVVDAIGDEAFSALRDGEVLTVAGGAVYRSDVLVAQGERRDTAEFEQTLERAREAVRGELGEFARNTLEYLSTEPELLTDNLVAPPLRVEMAHRHVLVVVRGLDYREDLAALRRSGYVSDLKPVLIGVDGGADALLDADLVPDLILGDFDSVSPAALRCGAQLLVHAYRDGEAPGAARLDELGLDYDVVRAAGTSEDVALRLAFEQDCLQIVEVGSHTSMVDFFDKGRRGMASTFLTRMRVASVLVDAKGVSRLYRTRIRKLDLVLLFGSVLVAATIMVAVTAPARLLIRTLWINVGW
ncbi:MAG TPA: hypothetical protein DEP69_07095 [Acidimicrobiaceae bacterium]|nr:hypothetical protein [Acidimicrobiaceae bacterium]